MIKAILRRCLRWTPYELRRRHEERILPDATFETIKLALAYFLESKPLPTFVQVGACDGVSGDPAHNFIRQGRIKAVLIEPIEQSWVKLRKTYEGVPNVSTVHAAVGNQDGEVTLFRVKETGKTVDKFWATQLASFNRAHLVAHGVPDHEIEAVQVPSLTLKTLISQHGMAKIDLLQIDTEGFDAEVVKMALDLPAPPDVINFENVHLTPDATDEVFNRLKKSGYVWTHDKWDTLAIHQGLVERWTEGATATL